MAKKKIMITVDEKLLKEIDKEMQRSFVPSRSAFFCYSAVKLLRETNDLGYMDKSELPFPDVE